MKFDKEGFEACLNMLKIKINKIDEVKDVSLQDFHLRGACKSAKTLYDGFE